VSLVCVCVYATQRDLTSLALLPKTDPVSLLVQGSRTQAPSAGSTLDSCWVRGVRVVRAGAPSNVDLVALRRVLRAAQAVGLSVQVEFSLPVLRSEKQTVSKFAFTFNLYCLYRYKTEYRDPAITDSATDDKTSRAEVEFRAAMGLDDAGAAGDRAAYAWQGSTSYKPFCLSSETVLPIE
jgi:hypothetical protein